MKKTIGILILFLAPILAVFIVMKGQEKPSPKLELLKAKIEKRAAPGTDHSKFLQLQRKFDRPQDVTLACISCHTERHTEIMKTSHWRWLVDEYEEGKGIVSIGKRNAINNHCISIGGSEESCNRCHIGYGYSDKNFDFNKAENVDCLVCHDNSGVYEKEKEGAGMPKPSIDLSIPAQKVGLPKNSNCGICHFNGGGGNNSKHGDLEEGLYTATPDVDVHMAKAGANMQCVDCHEAKNHKMEGRLYTMASMDRDRLKCEKCHTDRPHEDDIINEHTVKVACQTCHIPEYAKMNATKTHWDWSKAGKLKNGKPYTEHDADDNETYLSIKGEIKWEKNLQPEYLWFNGTARHQMLTDKIDKFPLVLNPLGGNYDDPKAKIVPAKIMRTIQPYDPINMKLLSPKLFDKDSGKGAYWTEFNWKKSIDASMSYLDLPWSGQYAFGKTEMNWMLNHMVAPKEKSLKCENCHTRDNSRLAAIKDVYLPGRDRSMPIDTMGVGLLVLTFLGVISHGAVRVLYSRKEKSKKSSKETSNE